MPQFKTTADLYDEHGGSLGICTTQFHQYGQRTRFQGAITTFRGHEDNSLLRSVVNEPGHGRVIVIDGDGSLYCAMLGDQAADIAARNGWEGFIVNSAIRDAAALAEINIGVAALGTSPRKSGKEGKGWLNVPVAFGGAVFVPGTHVVCDEDGVVLLPRPAAD